MDYFGSEEEYQEAEIWGLMKPSEEASKTKPRKGSSSDAWGLKTTPRSILRAAALEEAPPQRSSAPLDIPGWPAILPKKKKKKMCRKNLWDDGYGTDNDGYYHGDVCDDHDCNHHDDDDDDDGDGHDGDEMVPPHEYLAKKFARAQIASYSMCEGVGRTLKGRDLSRLRNAILTKTGYLE